MWRLVKTLYLFCALLIGVLIAFNSLQYFDPDFSMGFLIDKQKFFSYYRIGLYCHMISAPIALILGLLQIVKIKSKFHQQVGKAYTLSILLFAAPSGLFMSFFSSGDIISKLSLIALSSLWFVFTLLGFQFIKKGKISQHQVYMTRSFILTNSAILLRVMMFLDQEYLHFGYALATLGSWLPPLVFFELYRFRPNHKNQLL